MAPEHRTEVLLAVFNGEKYLGAQIDSILGQTDQSWSLLVRDDGSSDRSAALLTAYQRRYPGKIRLIDAVNPSPGAQGNYSVLLEHASAEYLMFCDQDDVWFPDKIQVTLGKMKELEQSRGEDCPLLVHTDMKVADDSLRVLAESLWRYQKSDPERGASLNRLLVQNCATGCSMMINRALLELAVPIPREAMMHDWWLALAAAAFGGIGYCAQPTMLYRQHGGNDTGAKKWGLVDLVPRLTRVAGARAFFAERKLVLERTRAQARAFFERYATRLSRGQREMLEAYIALNDRPLLRRTWHLVKYRFFHAGVARNVVRFILS
jgi:glycosyltransferase involved in cell wall biosynthesis